MLHLSYHVTRMIIPQLICPSSFRCGEVILTRNSFLTEPSSCFRECLCPTAPLLPFMGTTPHFLIRSEFHHDISPLLTSLHPPPSLSTTSNPPSSTPSLHSSITTTIMARLLTWDDVFEYAVMQSSLPEKFLRSSFDEILQRTKKTCPIKKSGLSEKEIHFNVEIQWWNSLCTLPSNL
jgi:hypothetical protein